MISVAEESGKLDGELVRIAVVTEAIWTATQDRRGAGRTIMLFLIAAFIGTIFIGMLLPILSMSQYIK